MNDNYDILKKHTDGVWIRIESLKDLQTAREPLKQLASRSPGEYLAVNQMNQLVTAKESSHAVTL